MKARTCCPQNSASTVSSPSRLDEDRYVDCLCDTFLDIFRTSAPIVIQTNLGQILLQNSTCTKITNTSIVLRKKSIVYFCTCHLIAIPFLSDVLSVCLMQKIPDTAALTTARYCKVQIGCKKKSLYSTE